MEVRVSGLPPHDHGQGGPRLMSTMTAFRERKEDIRTFEALSPRGPRSSAYGWFRGKAVPIPTDAVGLRNALETPLRVIVEPDSRARAGEDPP